MRSIQSIPSRYPEFAFALAEKSIFIIALPHAPVNLSNRDRAKGSGCGFFSSATNGEPSAFCLPAKTARKSWEIAKCIFISHELGNMKLILQDAQGKAVKIDGFAKLALKIDPESAN
ncbi:MAG TPA: hypothetical protein IAB02_09895 [Candidatus Pullichristensenella excrementigallinarum]|uniref:Uncharacterized protein n=1 Tax=Candidatus Pullichristensenella excrementigallinarum TaxID=2840907 RepID=A0A9D1ICG1_9FIRM|nr:hypothetical protein [Candidatus Pullichristensenella excrementigallinarum]